MARWWENERSLTAASIRKTRRRLRAAFRASERRAWDEAEDYADRRNRIAADHAASIDGWLKLMVRAFVRLAFAAVDSRYSTTLKVEVGIADEVLVRSDSEAVRAQVARSIGRAVEQAVLDEDWGRLAKKHARLKTRPVQPSLNMGSPLRVTLETEGQP